jgi:hypothetical protein
VGVLGPPLLLNFDFDAVSDPDPAFDFDVDPEPAFFSHRVANADMDPSSQNDAYPNPQHCFSLGTVIVWTGGLVSIC